MKPSFQKYVLVPVTIVIITGILVLLGWQFNIEIFKRPVADLAAMNPMTALSFVLSGLSLLLLIRSRKNKYKLFGKILSGFVIATGLLRLIGIMGIYDAQIDEWLYASKFSSDAAGNLLSHMAPNTAFNFILTGFCLFLLNYETPGKRMPAHYLALLIASVGLFSVLGYIYQVKEFYGVLVYIPMSIHTAACFLLLSVAILFASPDKGIMKELTSPYAGGTMAKRLIPAVIVIPFLLGFFRLIGHWKKIFTTEFGVALLVLSIIIVFFGVVWYNAKLLNKRDDERKNAEEKLEKVEQQYRLMVDEVEDYAIIFLDNKGLVRSWNRGAEKIKGYKAEEIISKSFRLFYTKEDQESGFPEKLITEAAQNGKAIHEGWRIRKDGTSFWGSVTITALHDGNNKILGFTKVTRDITERKKAEEKFRNLLESAPDAIVIVNDRGVIQLVNAQTEKLFSYKRNEIIGKTVELLMPSRYEGVHQGHRTDFFKSPKVRQMGEGFELFGKKKNGTEFPVEISLSPLETDEGLLVSAAIRDISEKKQMENQIREANVNLEKKVHQRTEELETKNRELEQFAYVASHDLQEPLRTTSSFVDLFKKKYLGKLDGEADTILTYIVQSSDRMKILIKDLLDYSRIGKKTNIHQVDCTIILNEVIIDLSKYIQETKTKVNIGKLPLVNGYPTELKLIFQNLIINAIKFRREGIAPVINISAERKGVYWQFSVEDNGIGIEDKHKERIFVIFQRLHTRSEYEGSGIGLAHCKKIAQLHGGKIWVDSVPGKGSIFYFTIHEM